MLLDYVTLKSGRQLHYRTQGIGPALIMLHPSPQNSEVLIPAISAFSETCTCIAFDTPGYGLSDALPITAPQISDYADTIVEAAAMLGLEKFFIFGAATGAIVTIEIAKKYPEKIHMAMVDSYGHMTEEERERTLDGYMPDVSPKRDGGHLFTYWDMCRHLFDAFPWHSGRAEDRLPLDLPPAEFVHDVMLRYLQAGEGYASAYLPAMHKENIKHFDGLNVPTTLMRWQDSVVVSLTDAMIAEGLPQCVNVLKAEAGVEARFSVQRDALSAKIAVLQLADFKLKKVSVKPCEKLERQYFSGGNIALHGYGASAPSGEPLVFLHKCGASAAQMLRYARPYIGERPVVMLDLPGHGASSSSNDLSAIETYVRSVAPAVASLGQSVEIVAEGLGAAVALLVAQKASRWNTNINKVTIVDPIPLSDDERTRHNEFGFPDLTPRHDASHLAKVWSMVRDDALFWPWFDHRATAKRQQDADVSPSSLHKKAVDILRLGARWQQAALLELNINWPELIAEASGVTEVAFHISDNHPCPDRIDTLA